MAPRVMSDCRIWLDGYDLSGDSNVVGLDGGVDLLDTTTFGSGGWRERAPGLKTVAARAEGFVNLADNAGDETVFGALGAASDRLLTLIPETGAEGEVAYSFLADLASYDVGAPLGEVHGFSLTAEGSGVLVRGTLMHHATRTGGANGTARQLGAVGATQKLYAALHVLAISGSTPVLTVTVQSDDAIGMGSPTNRVVFNAASVVGAQWAAPVAGAVTDQWWRVTWTLTGGGPSALFAVVVGIQ